MDRKPLIDSLDRDVEQQFVETGSMPEVAAEPTLKIATEPMKAHTRPENSETIRRRQTRKQGPIGAVARVPVTLRLLPDVAGALKRASLERQLDGIEPHTQQDLAELVLEPWLREGGYLKT